MLWHAGKEIGLVDAWCITVVSKVDELVHAREIETLLPQVSMHVRSRGRDGPKVDVV